MTAIRWSGPPCPQDEAHGRLLDWPSATAGYYCPHVRHRGTPFHTTDLAPAPRPRSDDPTARSGTGARGGARTGTGAPVPPPSDRPAPV